MEFYDDPRRAQIEPMHEFMQTWARWGRFRLIRHESMTYKIMCWIRDHSRRIEEIREGIVLGQRIHCRDEDQERIALKVEHYLRVLRESGKTSEVERLRFYYLQCHPAMPLGKIAQRIGCRSWQVEEQIKKDLIELARLWMD